VFAADAGPMEIEWGGDNGDEGCQGCAVEHGRRLRELTNERAYREDETEEIGKRDLVRGKTQR
jgi:hypothetical protein